jgi:hypothetical protein
VSAESIEWPEVPPPTAIIAEEEALRKSNDLRLKQMIAMYGQAPDPSTWNNARIAALCDQMWGAEGTPERATAELSLQKQFEKIITKAEEHLGRMRLAGGLPAMPQNGNGGISPGGLILP